MCAVDKIMRVKSVESKSARFRRILAQVNYLKLLYIEC